MMIGLILLIAITYYLFSPSSSNASYCTEHYQPQANTPMEILNERYARGEILREEYLERKQELSRQKQIPLKKKI